MLTAIHFSHFIPDSKGEEHYCCGFNMGENVARTTMTLQANLRECCNVNLGYDTVKTLWAQFSESCCAVWLEYNEMFFEEFCKFYSLQKVS